MADINKHGGEPVAAGTYGCVFNPALKCVGTHTSGPASGLASASSTLPMISKLMYKKWAILEYDEITQFAKIIQTIPDYKDYFLVDDISICSPNSNSITDEDLQKFNKKCKNFVKDKIDSENIREKIETQPDKFRILNMLDGGVDINTYYHEHLPIDSMFIVKLTVLLNQLIQNAVIPMNKKYLYHFDLKDNNILIDTKDQIRIIDWGLGGIAKNNNPKNIPDVLMGRSIQFNLPYTSILINNVFPKLYRDYLKGTCQSNWKHGLHEFTLIYVDMWQAKRGEGHMPFIIEDIVLVQPFYSFSLDPDNLVYNFIYKTLEKFTKYCEKEKKMVFDEKSFLDVFYHNVDLWGTLMCYITLFKYYKKGQTNIQKQQQVLKSIANILIEYCYLNPVKKINTQQLEKDLIKLVRLLGFDIHSIFNKSKTAQKAKTAQKSKDNKARKTHKTHNI